MNQGMHPAVFFLAIGSMLIAEELFQSVLAENNALPVAIDHYGEAYRLRNKPH